MNLRKSLVTLFATVGLMAGIAGPALAAPTETTTGDNEIDSYVVVSTSGSFNVYFNVAGFDLSAVTLSASAPQGTATGSFVVYYTDDMANRPNFNVQLTATDFAHTTEGWNTISNAGFKVVKTYNVEQAQWGGPTTSCSVAAGCTLPYDVGDIGHFQNNIYPTAGQGTTETWTASNELNQARTIQFGYSGVGTIASYGQVDVTLDVPATTVPGTYKSDMTLSVIAGTQP